MKKIVATFKVFEGALMESSECESFDARHANEPQER